jgi:hypothetical protein
MFLKDDPPTPRLAPVDCEEGNFFHTPFCPKLRLSLRPGIMQLHIRISHLLLPDLGWAQKPATNNKQDCCLAGTYRLGISLGMKCTAAQRHQFQQWQRDRQGSGAEYDLRYCPAAGPCLCHYPLYWWGLGLG